MINQIPAIFRLFAGNFSTIQQRAAQKAFDMGITYNEQTAENFRYDGWGLVGLPPRIACNAKFIHFDTGNVVDLGRITA